MLGLQNVWRLCSFWFTHYLLQSCFARADKVCLINVASNPRVASVFTRGMLEHYGSDNSYEVVDAGMNCAEGAVRINLVLYKQLSTKCTGLNICILVADERCKAPGGGRASMARWIRRENAVLKGVDTLVIGNKHKTIIDQIVSLISDWDEGYYEEEGDPRLQRNDSDVSIDMQLIPNVILREFYSSKYNYPAFALGSRFEFEPVPEILSKASHRPIMFNFMGSVLPDKEPDRVHLQEVLRNNRWDQFTTRIHIFNELVRDPNMTTQYEYRNTLLASSFTLAPVGTADDCFRFWESIEAGSIPIFVRRVVRSYKKYHCPDAFEDVLATNPPIILLSTWDELPAFLEKVKESEIEDMRQRLSLWNHDFWVNTTQTIDKAIRKAATPRRAYKIMQEAHVFMN